MDADEEKTLSPREMGIMPDALSSVGAFLEATQRHRSQYVWLVRRMTGCTDEAEDIVQHAFLRAYANLHRFRGEARISTWLRTIVQNEAHEYLRSQKGHLLLSLESDEDRDGQSFTIELRDSRLTPEESYSRRERERILVQEISRLGSYSRRAIQMCILDEFSQAEAAIMLGVTVASIKSRIFRGKQHLHHALCPQIEGNRIDGL